MSSIDRCMSYEEEDTCKGWSERMCSIDNLCNVFSKEEEKEQEKEDLFVFNDTIQGPIA